MNMIMEREQAVTETVAAVRRIESEQGVTTASLDAIRAALICIWRATRFLRQLMQQSQLAKLLIR